MKTYVRRKSGMLRRRRLRGAQRLHESSEMLPQRQSIRRILQNSGGQAKLSIGQPNDKYEQEADRVADQVIQMPDATVLRQSEPEESEESVQAKPIADQITPLVQCQAEEEEKPVQAKLVQRQPEEEEETVQAKLVQRQPEEEEEAVQAKQIQRQAEEEEEPAQAKPIQRQPEEEEEAVQAKSEIGRSAAVSSRTESNINSMKEGGRPLDAATRSYFEPRFGADFSHVKVHHDTRAAETAKSIQARAFTSENHVVFGSGEFKPETSEGKRLIGHELTHVVQQKGYRGDSIRREVNLHSAPDPVKGPKSDLFSGDRILLKVFNNQRTLHEGDGNGILGAAVQKVQKALLRLDYKLPNHGADGGYGTETKKAILAYQKKNFGQLHNGVVDQKTLKKMDDELRLKIRFGNPVNVLVQEYTGQRKQAVIEAMAIAMIMVSNALNLIKRPPGKRYGKWFDFHYQPPTKKLGGTPTLFKLWKELVRYLNRPLFKGRFDSKKWRADLRAQRRNEALMRRIRRKYSNKMPLLIRLNKDRIRLRKLRKAWEKLFLEMNSKRIEVEHMDPAQVARGRTYDEYYAYVKISDNKYHIWVGGAFWRADMRVRAMTFVHEMSHEVAGTKDFGGDEGYGRAKAIELAKRSPDMAAKSAENWCYFAGDA